MSTSRILISAVLLLSSVAVATAFDITKLLDKYPEYTQFNNLLTKTKIADEINSRKTITVLAINNNHIGEIAGKSEDVQKRILSSHVVLDYYDTQKLKQLKTDTKTQLTTLFQASGTAGDQQGFLNVINQKDGIVVFGSAAKDAPVDAKMESSILSQPFNISVLSISKPIVAPGIENLKPVSSSSAPKAAPAPSKTTPAASPEKEKAASAPTPADAPATKAPAPAPKADAPAADQSPPSSAAGKQMVSGVSVGLIVAFASFLAAH
ncbi:hypothetical protein BUALT_Bualt10G0091500 [Buddleja alternifolia]|uniref:FAS1 domain-containing protein n=1 Tax=Buddleja alternifolia TaxID=168488 RepID=A0AAV6X837_9LAMI|nr:hypothetical protein BUALT_Bualt10G0091500 [Buddleja alternifolia]